MAWKKIDGKKLSSFADSRYQIDDGKLLDKFNRDNGTNYVLNDSQKFIYDTATNSYLLVDKSKKDGTDYKKWEMGDGSDGGEAQDAETTEESPEAQDSDIQLKEVPGKPNSLKESLNFFDDWNKFKDKWNIKDDSEFMQILKGHQKTVVDALKEKMGDKLFTKFKDSGGLKKLMNSTNLVEKFKTFNQNFSKLKEQINLYKKATSTLKEYTELPKSILKKGLTKFMAPKIQSLLRLGSVEEAAALFEDIGEFILLLF